MHRFSLLCLAASAALAVPITHEQGPSDAKNILAQRSVGVNAIGSNFPDPAIFYNDQGWWAFATRTPNAGIHVPVAHSTDFKSWNVVQNSDGSQLDAMPTIPAWAASPTANFWAPDVSHLDDGSYLLYFSASTRADPTKHCVGAAKSTSITGPFVPTSDQPLFCPLDQGGAIDASGFQDPKDNSRYIVYKVDGNSIGNGGTCGNDVAPFKSTPLLLQKVDSDGVSLIGDAVQLLDNNGAEDTGIVEAPALARSPKPNADGKYTYFLFFSRNCYATKDYTVSYAVSTESIAGPYTRKGEVWGNNAGGGIFYAPGGADVFRDGQHVVFHSGPVGQRQMNTASIELDDATVTWR